MRTILFLFLASLGCWAQVSAPSPCPGGITNAPGTINFVLQSNANGTCTWVAGGGAPQTFPSAGIMVSNGSAFGTSLAAPTGSLVGTGQANTYTAGAKQSVQASATTAGFNFGGVTADPSGAVAGDLWYRTDLGSGLVSYQNATTAKSLVTGARALTTSGCLPKQSGSTGDLACSVLTLSGSSATVFALPSSGTPTYTFPAASATLATLGANTFTASQIITGATTTGPDIEVGLTGDTVNRIALGLNTTDIPRLSFGPGGDSNRDLFLERAGAATLRFGAPDAASPVAQTLGVQNVLGGTSNTDGANLVINGSRGTGTGLGGIIQFQTAPAGSTGTVVNALVAAMTILGNGNVGIGTTAPARTLDVLGSSNYAAQIKGSAGGGFILGSYDSAWGGFWASNITPASGNYTLITNGVVGTALNAPSGTYIQFNINDTVKMILDSTGNVGIGTTSPSYLVDIAKSGTSGTFRAYDQTATTGVTKATIRDGAGQSTVPSFRVTNNAGTAFSVVANGVVGSGIILTDSGGACWTVVPTVSTGVLTSTTVTCPTVP